MRLDRGAWTEAGRAPRVPFAVRAVAMLIVVAFLVVATATTVVSLGSFCLTTQASAPRSPSR